MSFVENLFDGPATGPPQAWAAQAVTYAELPVSAGPIRHVGGYAPFVSYCANQGMNAGTLARDVKGLFGFLHVHGGVLAADPTLRHAAAVFAANAIVGLRPDASWTGMNGGSPMAGNNSTVFETAELVEQLPAAPQEAVDGLLEHIQAWAQEPVDDTPELEVPTVADRDEPSFIRPDLPEIEYLDASGEPIAYGRRWEGVEAPEDSYEVLSHPERFEGLHTVARALIAHLQASYDVQVMDVDLSTLPGDEAEHTLRVVRLEPAGGSGAPLELTFQDFPSIRVRAGVLQSFAFPDCGCDACDDALTAVVENLEELVLSVVAGGYRERYPSGPKHWSEYALSGLDSLGPSGGRGEPETKDPEVLSAAEERLRLLPEGWQAWTLLKR